MDKNTRTFDKRMRTLLTVSGMDCDELARRLDVAVPVVRRWANGSSAPDVYQIRKIAQIFGMSYEWLLDGDHGLSNPDMLASRLGLSADTVEDLMMVADMESQEVLDALDDMVASAINTIITVREDQ